MKVVKAKEYPQYFDLILKEYNAFYLKNFGEDLSEYMSSKYASLISSKGTYLILHREESQVFPIGVYNIGTVSNWGEVRLFYMRPSFFNKENFVSVWLTMLSNFDIDVKKVSFQSRFFTIPPYSAIFDFNLNFKIFKRIDMVYEIKNNEEKKESNLSFHTLPDNNYKSIAFLYYLTFKNSIDYKIIPYYQNIDYARSLVKSILDNNIGVYLPDISFIIKRGNIPSGLILASKLKDNAALLLAFGFFEQIRGKGYGREVLNNYLAEVRKKGYKKVYLTVTQENAPAYRLYSEFDFKKSAEYYLLISSVTEKIKKGKNIEEFRAKKIF